MTESGASRYTTYPRWPIRSMAARDRLTKGQEYAPRIELTVGRDAYSGGITLTAWIHGAEGEAPPKVVFAHRWQSKPQSLEECLQVAYRGIAAYMMEAGISFE